MANPDVGLQKSGALFNTTRVVPEAGLEPACPGGRQILSLLRLPISPLGQKDGERSEVSGRDDCSAVRPITAHFSPLTSHRSLLTAHFSPLTSHRSLLTAHFSPLTSHRSLLTAHFSPLTSHRSLLTAHSHRSLLTAHSLTAHFSPLTSHRSLSPLTSHRSLLTAHFSPLTSHRSLSPLTPSPAGRASGARPREAPRPSESGSRILLCQRSLSPDLPPEDTREPAASK